MGTFNACKAALPLLTLTKGTIINISATLHYRAVPLQSHAAAAKAGVDALTRTAAAEFGPLGIRVNAIAPGPIADTEGIKRLLSSSMRDKFINKIPLRQLGSVWDVAQMAVFLASNAGRWVTGQVMVVDGGEWLSSSL